MHEGTGIYSNERLVGTATASRRSRCGIPGKDAASRVRSCSDRLRRRLWLTCAPLTPWAHAAWATSVHWPGSPSNSTWWRRSTEPAGASVPRTARRWANSQSRWRSSGLARPAPSVTWQSSSIRAWRASRVYRGRPSLARHFITWPSRSATTSSNRRRWRSPRRPWRASNSRRTCLRSTPRTSIRTSPR